MSTYAFELGFLKEFPAGSNLTEKMWYSFGFQVGKFGELKYKENSLGKDEIYL